MPKYTVDWHDKAYRWEIVRWDDLGKGVRSGTVVERFAEDCRADAEEICDYYNDMEDPELWSDIGCEFDEKVL